MPESVQLLEQVRIRPRARRVSRRMLPGSDDASWASGSTSSQASPAALTRSIASSDRATRVQWAHSVQRTAGNASTAALLTAQRDELPEGGVPEGTSEEGPAGSGAAQGGDTDSAGGPGTPTTEGGGAGGVDASGTGGGPAQEGCQVHSKVLMEAPCAALALTVPGAAAAVSGCTEVIGPITKYFYGGGFWPTFKGGESSVADRMAADTEPYTYSDGPVRREAEEGVKALDQASRMNLRLAGQLRVEQVLKHDDSIVWMAPSSPGGVLFGEVGEGDAAKDTRTRTSTLNLSVVPGAPEGQMNVAVDVGIEYLHTDTFDFCPGNVEGNNWLYHEGLVMMSNCEASGLAADVPISAHYFRHVTTDVISLPDPLVGPKPGPGPGPAPKKDTRHGPAQTKGTYLNIRSGPGRSFPVVGQLAAKGTSVTVSGQEHGETATAHGVPSDLWDKIDGGYVFDGYVDFDEPAPQTALDEAADDPSGGAMAMAGDAGSEEDDGGALAVIEDGAGEEPSGDIDA